MIKPEQIPDEVVDALQRYLQGCYCDECMRRGLAVAINAWPGGHSFTMVPRIVLPLPTENSDE